MKEGLIDKKATYIEKVIAKFPLSYWGIVKRMVGDNFSTILDVGCGTGTQIEIINTDNKYQVTGIDIYEPYIKECKKKGIYKKVIKGDARKMNFPKKSFDVVICFHVIEHMTKNEGFAIIKKLETIARKRVVLALPIGHLHQEAFDENKHQEHKSAWYPNYFKMRGYTVVGQGLRFIYKQENIVKKYGIFSFFFFFFSMLFQPILFIKPEYGVYMICKKDLS